MIPLAQHMIVTAGWRHAYLVFAIVSAVFVPLLLVLPWSRIAVGAPGLVRQHAEAGAGPTVGQAVRDWPFWALTFSFGFTSVGIFSIVPQAMSYLLERGLEGGYAARALAVSGVLTPLGMVGFSWLADRGGRKIAAILAYGCSILGVGALALVQGPGDVFWLWVYVLLFGGSQGSRGPMISTLGDLALSRRPFRPHLRPDRHRHGAGRLLRRLDRRPAARPHRRLCRGDDLLRLRARPGRRLAGQRGRRAGEAQPLRLIGPRASCALMI